MSDIEDFINALDSGDTASANGMFASAMNSRMSTVLDAKKVELADRVYNGAVEDLGQEDDEIQDSEIGSD
jgi:hypothetical protein